MKLEDYTKASIRGALVDEGRAQLREWREFDDETIAAATNVGESGDGYQLPIESPSTERAKPVLDLGSLFTEVKPTPARRQRKRKPSKQKRHTNQQPACIPNEVYLQNDNYSNHAKPEAKSISIQVNEDLEKQVPARADILPQGFYQSSLGPKMRSTFVMRSEKNCILALVICPLGEEMKVVSVISGQFLEQTRKNQIKQLLQEEVHSCSSNSPQMTSFSQKETYLETCNKLFNHRNELASKLEDHNASSTSSPPLQYMNQYDLLQGAFDRANLRLEPAANDFELFSLWLNQVDSYPAYAMKNDKNSHGTCLVCFEEIPEGSAMSKISSCGHVTCRDCWCAYLASAAASGHRAKLQCPALKCKESINLLDAAHLLFVNEKSDTVADTSHEETFDRLVENELEHFSKSSSSCISGYCPFPLCGKRMAGISRDEDKQEGVTHNLGWNILLCLSCGSTRCADCPTGASSNQWAHPGMSCSVYAGHRKRLDQGKSEAESILYLIKNTRPCPKCQFAIEKNGGCNHVSCQRCDYYFCWQCGGPGSDCQSYRCLNTNKLWYQESPDSDDENWYCNLSALARKYIAFRQEASRLSSLRTSIAKLFKKSTLSLRDPIRFSSAVVEQQIQQVIVWLFAVLIHKENLDERSSEELQRLRLAAQATRIRLEILENRVESFKPTSSASLSLDDVEKALERTSGSHIKPRNRRKLELQNKRMEQKGFSALMADFDLKEMCCLSEEKLFRACQNNIGAALLSLQREQQESPANYCHRRRRRSNVLELDKMYALNKKSAKSPMAPWKQGLKKQVEDSNESDCDHAKVVWKKGKARVKTQRHHNLDSNTGS